MPLKILNHTNWPVRMHDQWGKLSSSSTEDILKVQNRIKKEVGKKKVSESNLKTSLVLYGSGSSNYGSDDFVNSKGSAASSEVSSNYEPGHLRQQVVDR